MASGRNISSPIGFRHVSFMRSRYSFTNTCITLITYRINAQSTENRTIEKVKKKLSDMKSAVKKRKRERRQQCSKAGGGQAQH